MSAAATKAAWPFGDLKMFGYDVVMIDPPWRWMAWGGGGEWKSPNRQYKTMTLEQVAALPVADLLRDRGVLWCWCTWPRIAHQTAIIEGKFRGIDGKAEKPVGWNLNVKTGGAWAKRTASGKLRWGTGYVIRSVCEPFILATATMGSDHGFIGSAVKNMLETIEDGVVDGLAREHSRKPEEAYSIIEALTPEAFRADVFSRHVRPGWDGFGDELNKFGATP